MNIIFGKLVHRPRTTRELLPLVEHLGSRRLINKVADDLSIQRAYEGFGSEKTCTWSLPRYIKPPR